MQVLRQLPGAILAAVLAAVGGALMLLAWFGWADRFGWEWALLALVLSWMGGFNAFAVVGALFFALDYLHWPLPQCVALASVGLLFATRSIMQGIIDFLTAERLPPRG